jgi:hypothetical protein
VLLSVVAFACSQMGLRLFRANGHPRACESIEHLIAPRSTVYDADGLAVIHAAWAKVSGELDHRFAPANACRLA